MPDVNHVNHVSDVPGIHDQPGVTVTPATEADHAALRRLFQLYWHDLSELRGSMPDRDGILVPGRFEERLATPGLVTHVVESGDRLAGFAMVRPHEGRHLMAEFFVVRAVRRRGVGAAAARTVLARTPGPWSIPFQEENAGAARFWRALATEVATDVVEERRPVPEKPHIPPDVWLFLTVPG